jgi:DNA-binding response OmpR family regulator
MPQATIFIVEHESVVAEDIRQTLTDQGYAIAGIAPSGEAALPALEETRPDLVLMDIHLGGTMDGIETAGIIRDRFGYPVVILTAHSDEVNIARAKLTGPYGYILKPFNERELHSTIEMALSRHRMDLMVKERERTIRVLANAIPDAVMLLDRRGKILAANDAMACTLREVSPLQEEMPAFLPLSIGRYASLTPWIEEAFASLAAVRFEEIEGETWYEVSLRPVAGPNPEAPLLLVQYHDITDRKRFEEELRIGGITQIEQNMEQFQILNDEIRNPLQAILGYISLDRHQYHDEIVEQIRMIDDLVHRLDQGWVESRKVRRFLMRHYLEETKPAQPVRKQP